MLEELKKEKEKRRLYGFQNTIICDMWTHVFAASYVGVSGRPRVLT